MKALPVLVALLLAACGEQPVPPRVAPSLLGLACASARAAATEPSHLKTRGEPTCIAT
jgi:hypothetical protein